MGEYGVIGGKNKKSIRSVRTLCFGNGNVKGDGFDITKFSEYTEGRVK